MTQCEDVNGLGFNLGAMVKTFNLFNAGVGVGSRGALPITGITIHKDARRP